MHLSECLLYCLILFRWLILTNSLDWSFALVERGVKEKIKVTSTLHFDIKSYGVDNVMFIC